VIGFKGELSCDALKPDNQSHKLIDVDNLERLE